jgi:hypothetical protein
MSRVIKGWFSGWLYNYLKARYTKKMLYYKKIADYNLYRHNEAVDNYKSKSMNRASLNTDQSAAMGFFIADECADLAAKNYNENWDLYIKFRNKLEVMDYEDELLKLTINNTNTES